jgi:MFS family permease
MKRLFSNAQLLRLDASIFMLHLLITAVFFAVPLALRDAGIVTERQWLVYLPAVILSLGVMVPMIIWGERRAMRPVLLFSVAGLAVTQLIFARPDLLGENARILLLFAGITAFFSCLNTLEALLPSLVSRLAPGTAKGSAMGIYSSSQFLGAFIGGAGAGWLYGSIGPQGLFAVMVVLCALWSLILLGFRQPGARTTELYVSPVDIGK